MSGVWDGDTESALDKVLRTYIGITRKIIIVVSCTFFAIMVAVNGLEIISRALFSVSYSWVQEVSILSAMWIYFFAYALIAKNEEYIRVDFAVQFMPDWLQRAVNLFARLATILFHGLLVWFGVETFKFLNLFTTSVLIWPESLFVLPLLIGAADILITELIYLYWQLTGHRLPHPNPIPATVE